MTFCTKSKKLSYGNIIPQGHALLTGETAISKVHIMVK